MAQPKTYHLITLGCPKNDVDSEHFERLLAGGELLPVLNAADADAIVVNTCGFIEQSQAQSMEAVQLLAAGKRPDQTLIVAGCMTQLYGAQLTSEVPAVDHVFGVGQWRDVAKLLQVDWCPDLLQRCRATRTQDGMSREERYANQKAALEVPVNRQQLVAGRDILIVDDVMTSGATLSAAAEACFAAGAALVDVVVLARVARDA